MILAHHEVLLLAEPAFAAALAASLVCVRGWVRRLGRRRPGS